MKPIDFKLLTFALQLLKSGNVEVRTNNRKSIVVTVNKNIIDLNFIDPSPFKSNKKRGILDSLEEARGLGKELAKKDLTVSLSRKDKTMIKIGKDAKPKLSRLITRSKDIQLVNLKELRRMDKELG
ncbi:MAG: hypothetical protein ACE5KA_09045 [Nitrososphaerales archaeon]